MAVLTMCTDVFTVGDAQRICHVRGNPPKPNQRTRPINRERIHMRILYTLSLSLTVTAMFGIGLMSAPSASAAPNDRRIFYMTDSNPVIVSINPDGSDRRVLGPGLVPRPSPDGQQVAYAQYTVGTPTRDLVVVNGDGTGAINLTHNTTLTIRPRVSWSPDGTRIAFIRMASFFGGDSDLYTIGSDGNGETKLTSTSGVNLDYPVWSPDGSKILFSGYIGGLFGIYSLKTDGSDLHLLVTEAWNASWSPDGSKIVFESSFGGPSSEIGVANSDGSNAVALTSNTGHDGYPVWSPDGSRIAFITNCNCGQPTEIDTVKPDGTGRIQVAAPAQGGDIAQPAWSPDSTIIIFTRYAPDLGAPYNYRLFAAPASGGNQTLLVTETDGIGYPSWGYPVFIPPPDTTPPSLGTPIWSENPKPLTGTTMLTVSATDALSGIAAGEYFLDIDHGPGNNTPITFGSGNLSATIGTNLAIGVFQVGIRARDTAGNWSTPAYTMLVVYDPAIAVGVTGKNKDDLVPSLANGDILPGLSSSTQTDTVDYGFTVDYTNGTLDPHNDLMLVYKTGTQCNTPHPQGCHTFAISATSFAWMIIDQANNSRGRFQGTATITTDGVTTSNPFTVEGIDGDRLAPAANDQFTVKIYLSGADPVTATPIYQVSASLAKGNSIKVR